MKASSIHHISQSIKYSASITPQSDSKSSLLFHDQCHLECISWSGRELFSPTPWFSSACLWTWNLQSLIYNMRVSHGIKWKTQTLWVRMVIPNSGAAQHHLIRNYHSPPQGQGSSYIPSVLFSERLWLRRCVRTGSVHQVESCWRWLLRVCINWCIDWLSTA